MAGESVKTLSCPSCAGTILLHMPGQSIAAVCSSCSTVLDTTSGSAEIIKKYSEKAHIQPEIPFGVKGELFGNKWMCLGLIVKKETKWGFKWKEYLLFNPKEGFRWLTESDGHWSIVTTLPKKPVEDFDYEMFFYGHACLSHQGRNFRLYHRGEAEVDYCLGEFYWRVQKGQKLRFADYVRPGESITIETESAEQVSSYAIYLEPEVVRKAFNLKSISQPMKVSPVQPGGYESQWKEVKTQWMYFSIILLLMFIFSSVGSESKYLGATQQSYYAGSAAEVKKLAVFNIPSTQNIEFKLKAPVSNNWLEVNYTLVNKKTGDSFDFDQGVEYYFGRDSDGNWSEGSQESYKLLSSIPPGSYELLAQPTGPVSAPFEVAVKGNVPIYSNFIIFLIILSIIPLTFLVLMYNDLAARWSESDYSPFAGGDE